MGRSGLSWRSQGVGKAGVPRGAWKHHLVSAAVSSDLIPRPVEPSLGSWGVAVGFVFGGGSPLEGGLEGGEMVVRVTALQSLMWGPEAGGAVG